MTKPRTRRWFGLTLATIGVGLLAVNLAGLHYYVLPIGERVRHDAHAWLKPSGYAGQAAGVLALVLFLFMYLYPLRKRVRRLEFLGSLPRWLDVHILCGLTIPVVGAMHAGWRFQGLIGLGYGAMLMVSLSGIVGRYLYVHIPRTRAGLDLGSEQIKRRRDALTREIAEAAAIPVAEVESALALAADPERPRGTLRAFAALIASDLRRFRTTRALRRRWGGGGAIDPTRLTASIRLARRQIALSEQRRMLDGTQRLFRLWHVVHRPFSVTALLAVLIHVSVAIVMGVTWFW